jgi:hypothetical protein
MACADPYGIHTKYDRGPFTDIRGLSGDHVNGDGSEWRRKLSVRTSIKTYRMAKKLNWPPIFQVLCMSCQLIKKKRNREYGSRKLRVLRSGLDEKTIAQPPPLLVCVSCIVHSSKV